MSSEEMLDQSIHDMVNNMREEIDLGTSLEKIGVSIFRSQMTDAFRWETGPADYWRAVEECWRTQTKGTPIPTKYRTNKSVILKAYGIDHDLEGWREGGTSEVLGKSAIQNRISNGVALTAEGGYRKIIHIINKVKHDSGDEAYETLKGLLMRGVL